MAVAGNFARTNAGADLRYVDARLLFPIAYTAMIEEFLVTEEYDKARNQLNRKLSDLQFERDTGLPGWARNMPSADQFVKEVTK